MYNCKSIHFITLIVIFFSYVEISSGFEARKLIRPCKVLSPECLKESIQNAVPEFTSGIPELGLQRLDPFYVQELNLSLPGDLMLTFKNTIAEGFKDCVVNSIKLISNQLRAKFRCDLRVRGDYLARGRLLVFKVNGEGKALIACRDIHFDAVFKLATKVGADGKQRHIEIKDYTVRHSFDGPVTYNLTNLFKKNDYLSKLVLDFMNKNWRVIADEFGAPIVEFGVQTAVMNLKKLLSVIPLQDIVIAPVTF